MSEPRTNAPFVIVHAAQREACDAVWEHDPRAACVIGAARYYNRFRLNASLLIRGGGPVLYAANFFEPKVCGRPLTHRVAAPEHIGLQPLSKLLRAQGVGLQQ